jgi:hypothetical protein
MNVRCSYNLITSVVGFKSKDTAIEVIDGNGDVRLFRGGIKSTFCACDPEPIVNKECDTKWFTNFNQRLLDKIRDYKKINS